MNQNEMLLSLLDLT